MGLFRVFNKKPNPETDNRKEEQRMFRWYLSKVQGRTNIPEEEVDKWFEREDDWRHLEDYGIYIEEHKENRYAFNPYDRQYDHYFGRTYPKECAQAEEQTRRFMARSAEIIVFKVESHRIYGATQERTRLKSLWMKRLLKAAVVFTVLLIAGWSVIDYFGWGRHRPKLYYLCQKYIVPLFSSEKSYTLAGRITNNPENKEMMYMAFNKSDNIFDTLYIDSARIINGRFTFKGKIPYPVRTFLSTTPEGTIYTHPSTTSIVYLDTDGPVKCEIDLNNPFYPIVKGSAINDDWQRVSKMLREDLERGEEPDYIKAFKSLPINSPVNFTLLREFIFWNQEGNLAYAKQRLSEMSSAAKSSPAGLKLWKTIDKTEHTGRVLIDTPEFSATDIEGNTVHSSTLVGRDKGMVIFYFWVPGGEYTKFGDYQKQDFAQLQAIYDSCPKGSVSIVTICASGNPDKLAEWKALIPEYEGKEKWRNLRYYIDPNTFKIDNVYGKMYLEGKLPVALLVNPSGLEFVYLEGSIDRTSAKTIKDYANWSYTYRYIIP